MHQPVFTLASALPSDEERREVFGSATSYQGLVERRLNEAPSIRRIFFLDLLDRPSTQCSSDINRQLVGHLIRELVVGVRCKGRDMERQDDFASR